MKTLEVEEAEWFKIGWAPDAEAIVRLGGCGLGQCEPVSPTWPVPVFEDQFNNEILFELESGRYWVRILWPENTLASSLRLTVERVEDPFAPPD